MRKVLIYFILIFNINCLVMCQENKGIGGYPDNYSVDSNGKYTHVDTSYFDDFVKDLQNKKTADRRNSPHKKNIMLHIKHENNDISLEDKTVVIFINKNDIIYNGPYKNPIRLDVGYQDAYYVNLSFYILDSKTKTVHKFTSELNYPIFNNGVTDIDVKLLADEKYKSGKELQFFYEITNLKSEVDQ